MNNKNSNYNIYCSNIINNQYNNNNNNNNNNNYKTNKNKIFSFFFKNSLANN